nr:hypothetical protein BaRGS_016986 [Batillaria attramentaria]
MKELFKDSTSWNFDAFGLVDVPSLAVMIFRVTEVEGNASVFDIKYWIQIQRIAHGLDSVFVFHEGKKYGELDKGTRGDSGYFVLTLACMVVYSVAVTAGGDAVSTRALLACGGILAAGLGIIGSFGFLSVLGLRFVNFVGIMPFLVIGIGVDDMFLLMSAWAESQNERGLDVPGRVGSTFAKAGVGITITSLTDFLAFLIGFTSEFIAVRHFCVFTGVAVLLCYFANATLFGACLALHGQRVYSGDFSDESPCEKLPRVLLPRLILNPIFKLLLCISFVVYLVYSIIGLMNLETGMRYMDLVLESSYYYTFSGWDMEYFGQRLAVAFAVDGEVDYRLEPFIDGVKQFLSQNNNSILLNDVKFNEQNTSITASRCYVMTQNVVNPFKQAEIMLDLRDLADSWGLPVFVYQPTVGTAVAVMAIVTFAFLPQPLMVLLVTLNILAIMTGVFGSMYYLDITFSGMSMIHLLMSIGFSVDFSAHICAAYLMSDAVTRKERAEYAIVHASGPIFNGGTSSLLGVAMLLFSESYFFVTFFQIMSIVIIAGAWHAVFVMPVVLSFIGPENTHLANTVSPAPGPALPKGGGEPLPDLLQNRNKSCNIDNNLADSEPALAKEDGDKDSNDVHRQTNSEDGAPHTEGVALMLAPEAQRALIGWEPVNSRIITAKFITKKKDIKLNIIQCYAPTNDAEEEKKDDFYQQLQTVIDRGGAKDMTILMGDFNAKIGSDNTGYEDTMGTHGLGQMNENGERFADFCALNQLVIGGSIFPHKRIHKATWRSPDHVTENQTDHICISRKIRRSWRDVRVMRGADVSSDHHLLATTLRLRLKRHTNANSTRTRYNVGLLRNTDTQAAFRISLSNRFQPLQDLIEDSEMDIETQWEHSKKLWHDTCEEVLGKRKTQHKEWISADTIQKLEVRKEKKTALNTSRTRRAKAKAQEEYTAADREVKRSTRKDKRDYIDNLASQAEEAARQGNLKDLYQVTKKLAGKFQQTDKPVKDKNGHPLTTTEEQLKRWAEHFRELLNRPIPETPPDIPPAETELPINCDKPSKAEIRKAIMTLRNGKAAGPDEIPAEAIKADTETAVNMLHSLFSKIWEKEEVPAQWKEGIVIKLPKKGDLRDCSNYRGIMLLSVPGKVLNRILLERMREAVDPMLRDQQAGFRRNRSCADQIASLRIIVEQSLEWNSPLYINFIDYEKAFDSVDREVLWKLLRHYGVPGKIISLIQCTYQDMSCRIAHAGQLSESFEVKTGVRQGCLLSPFLFLLVIDWIMKTTTAGRKNGIQWTLWTQLDDLDFADDLALLSHSHSQMQDKTTCLEATSAGTGLKINRKKTELMKINTTANTPVTVGGEPIREVESFVYLGSVVDGQGGTDRDVTARIGKARAAMVMLKNVWASKVVSIRTKLRIFNSNVKSVLLYGCETWRTTKTMQQKIQTFLNTCLRRIFNIRWPEKIRNEELWERAGQEPVAKQILRRKWGWIGHTLRKPASSTTRQALTWNPQGKRKRGRPRNSWRRDTEAELFLHVYSPPNKQIQLDSITVDAHSRIATGDFNSHSPSWGYQDLNKKEEDHENWTISNQLILINKPEDPPTYYSRTWRTTSTPDLAFATDDLHSIAQREVCDQLGGSDHRPVIITIQRQLEIHPSRLPASWNYKKANWDLFKQEADRRTSSLTLSRQDINKNAKAFNQAVLKAAQAAIPRGRRKNYRPYWSPELNSLQKTVNEARDAMESSPTDKNVEAHNRARALFTKEKLQATRRS